jgi:hypothetical protein
MIWAEKIRNLAESIGKKIAENVGHTIDPSPCFQEKSRKVSKIAENGDYNIDPWP